MEIYPAIDLHKGQCVRLLRGEFSAVTVYGNDPAATARTFRDKGAQWLHVVDLDAAVDPKAHQRGALEALVSGSGLRLQVGGGVRDARRLQELLDLGVSRVIVGSAAVNDPESVVSWINRFGSDRVMVAFDVRLHGGVPMLATSGWKTTTTKPLWPLLDFHVRAGLRHCLCTDIGRDGALSGPALGLYEEIGRQAPELAVQASGGVARLRDVSDLKNAGLAGTIIGRALYEKRFGLEEAMAC